MKEKQFHQIVLIAVSYILMGGAYV